MGICSNVKKIIACNKTLKREKGNGKWERGGGKEDMRRRCVDAWK